MIVVLRQRRVRSGDRAAGGQGCHGRPWWRTAHWVPFVQRRRRVRSDQVVGRIGAKDLRIGFDL
jgi:hypothetical protein